MNEIKSLSLGEWHLRARWKYLTVSKRKRSFWEIILLEIGKGFFAKRLVRVGSRWNVGFAGSANAALRCFSFKLYEGCGLRRAMILRVFPLLYVATIDSWIFSLSDQSLAKTAFVSMKIPKSLTF
jgi:hypothetical protein